MFILFYFIPCNLVQVIALQCRHLLINEFLVDIFFYFYITIHTITCSCIVISIFIIYKRKSRYKQKKIWTGNRFRHTHVHTYIDVSIFFSFILYSAFSRIGRGNRMNEESREDNPFSFFQMNNFCPLLSITMITVKMVPLRRYGHCVFLLAIYVRVKKSYLLQYKNILQR